MTDGLVVKLDRIVYLVCFGPRCGKKSLLVIIIHLYSIPWGMESIKISVKVEMASFRSSLFLFTTDMNVFFVTFLIILSVCSWHSQIDRYLWFCSLLFYNYTLIIPKVYFINQYLEPAWVKVLVDIIKELKI